MEEISLTRWKPVVGGKWLYSCVHKDKGSPLSVYESGPVDALVKALQAIINSPTDAILRWQLAERALRAWEQSGNTGVVEDEK